MTLLRCFDDDIAILALEAVKSLAILPFSHRSLNFNHHVTALHKTSSHCAPLFQIVEAANWSFPLVAKEFLSPDFKVTDKHLLLEFDISQKPKVRISLSISLAFFNLVHHSVLIMSLVLEIRFMDLMLALCMIRHCQSPYSLLRTLRQTIDQSSIFLLRPGYHTSTYFR